MAINIPQPIVNAQSEGSYLIEAKDISITDGGVNKSLSVYLGNLSQNINTIVSDYNILSSNKLDATEGTPEKVGEKIYSYYTSNNSIAKTQQYELFRDSLDYIASDNNKKETIKNSLTTIIGETGSSTSIITSDDIFDAINSYVKENSQYKNFDLLTFIVQTCDSLNMEVPTTSQL